MKKDERYILWIYVTWAPVVSWLFNQCNQALIFGLIFAFYVLAPLLLTELIFARKWSLKQSEKDKDKKSGIMQRKLTKLTEDGMFVIEEENLADAIQKLGYLEHYSKEEEQ